LAALGRTAETTLRHASTLEALAPAPPTLGMPPASPLGRAQGFVAEFQHHDAITGTHEVNVTTMYREHLEAAIGNASEVAAEALRRLGVPVTAPPEPPALSAPRRTVATASFVLVRNPLAWDRRSALVSVAVDTRTLCGPILSRARSQRTDLQWRWLLRRCAWQRFGT